MMKTPVKVLIGIVVVVFVLAVLKDQIIKSAVAAGASRVLGTNVHIDGMSVGLIKQTIRIKGLKVDNPAGFPAGELINIEEAGVDYDLAAIMKGDLHLRTVILNMKEMHVIRNKEGKLNVNSLQVSQQKQATEPKEEKQSKQMPMRIDTVVLNLGKVYVENHATQPPQVQVFDIGVHNKTYKNITSAQQLAGLIMMESINPTAIRDFAFNTATKVLDEAVNVPGKVVGGVFDQLKKVMPVK